MRKVALLLGMFALTDCAEKTIYLRTDGQDMVGNSALHEQFELDRVTCQTDPGDTRDYMAVKGYVAVPEDQAAAKQRQLAAIAAQNAQQETVSEPPALRSTTAPKSLAGKKQKPKPAEITFDVVAELTARVLHGRVPDHDFAVEFCGVVSGLSLRSNIRDLSRKTTKRSGLFLTAAL